MNETKGTVAENATVDKEQEIKELVDDIEMALLISQSYAEIDGLNIEELAKRIEKEKYKQAEALFGLGYRKQSEVVKEIFNNLSNDKFIRDNNFGFCDLKEYAKEYGVEL